MKMADGFFSAATVNANFSADFPLTPKIRQRRPNSAAPGSKYESQSLWHYIWAGVPRHDVICRARLSSTALCRDVIYCFCDDVIIPSGDWQQLRHTTSLLLLLSRLDNISLHSNILGRSLAPRHRDVPERRRIIAETATPTDRVWLLSSSVKLNISYWVYLLTGWRS